MSTVQRDGTGFCCPKCGASAWVKDSRSTTHYGHASVRRRRLCSRCGYRFTTFESEEGTFDYRSFAKIVGATKRIKDACDRLLGQWDGKPLPQDDDFEEHPS